MDAELIRIVLGGGIAVIIGAIGKFIYDLRSGRVIKEDSAVAQWKGIAGSRLEEIRELIRELTWYRTYYPRLWHAYRLLPPDEKEQFPNVPPPPEQIADIPND